jgi:YD repeat-containing protein
MRRAHLSGHPRPFDGHGRLSASHRPEQRDSSNNPAYTTYTYNADDSIATVTDARGAVTTYAYNSRGLLEEVDFEPPATQPTYTTIADVPKVEFLYDNVGNRTQMIDGAGTQTYTYDELSRMTSETRTISGVTGSFTISYGYQLSGKLKSVTDPFGAVVNYNDDKTARTTSITGSNFAGVSTYASDIEYRAFGAVKELTYGSADSSVLSYEFRRPASRQQL